MARDQWDATFTQISIFWWPQVKFLVVSKLQWQDMENRSMCWATTNMRSFSSTFPIHHRFLVSLNHPFLFSGGVLCVSCLPKTEPFFEDKIEAKVLTSNRPRKNHGADGHCQSACYRQVCHHWLIIVADVFKIVFSKPLLNNCPFQPGTFLPVVG